MRPERGLVPRAALEAPDGWLVVRRLARRVPSPGRGEDARPRGIDGAQVPPELEDDLEDPERDDEEHELVELEGPDDEHIKAPAHAQQTRREINADENQRKPVRAPPARDGTHDANQAQSPPIYRRARAATRTRGRRTSAACASRRRAAPTGATTTTSWTSRAMARPRGASSRLSVFQWPHCCFYYKYESLIVRLSSIDHESPA